MDPIGAGPQQMGPPGWNPPGEQAGPHGGSALDEESAAVRIAHLPLWWTGEKTIPGVSERYDGWASIAHVVLHGQTGSRRHVDREGQATTAR